MGKITTNTTDRLPSGVPTNSIDIYDMNDFPAPSAGVITLVTGTQYIIKAPLSTSDRFELPASSDIEMKWENASFNILTYTGTDTLFTTAAPIIGFTMNDANVFTSDASATIFNLTGSTVFSFVRVKGSIFSAFDSIGTWDDFSFGQVAQCSFSGWTAGLTVTDIGQLAFDRTELTSGGTPFTTAIIVEGFKTTRAVFDIITVNMPSGEYLFIDPDIESNAVIDIDGNILRGGITNFFESGNTGNITLFADASFGATAVTDVGNAGPGEPAEFSFTVGPTLHVDQEVVISGFTGGNTIYNGTFRITVVVEPGLFQTGVPFVSAASGSFLSNTVTVTSATHGFAAGQALLIEGTIGYDGGTSIFDVQTNTFRINRGFAGAETVGNWNTGSLTETEPRMFVLNNGAQADSKTLGSIIRINNSTATVISAINTWTDLNLNSLAIQSSSTERFTIVDNDTGETRYDGVNPLKGSAVASISGISSGSAQEFQFRVVVDNNPLADGVVSAVELGGNTGLASLVVPVTLNTGQRVRVQVQNVDGSDNIVVQQLTLEIT